MRASSLIVPEMPFIGVPECGCDQRLGGAGSLFKISSLVAAIH